MTDNHDTPAAWAASMLAAAAAKATAVDAVAVDNHVLNNTLGIIVMIIVGFVQHALGDPGGVKQWWQLIKAMIGYDSAAGYSSVDLCNAVSHYYARIPGSADPTLIDAIADCSPVDYQDIPTWTALARADPDNNDADHGAGWLVHCLKQIVRFMSSTYKHNAIKLLQLGLNLGRALAMITNRPNSADARSLLDSIVSLDSAFGAVDDNGTVVVDGAVPAAIAAIYSAIPDDLVSAIPDDVVLPGTAAVAGFRALAKGS